MMLRRTDPKTGTRTLCELARSKCMPTCHKSHQKSHLIRKFTAKMMRPRLRPERRHILCASLHNPHINIFQGTSEDPAAQIEPRTRAHTLREPAQSKCTSTYYKRYKRN